MELIYKWHATHLWFLRLTGKLSLITKSPQQIQFLLFHFHSWTWATIVTSAIHHFQHLTRLKARVATLTLKLLKNLQTTKMQTQEERKWNLRLNTLEKLANDPRKNIGRKRTKIRGSTLFKNLQTTREQTHLKKNKYRRLQLNKLLKKKISKN